MPKPELDMLTRYKRALEGLTPSGSEYVNEPERCAEFVREARQSLMAVLIARVKRMHELETELDSLKTVRKTD